MKSVTWPLYRFNLATCFCAMGSCSSRHLIVEEVLSESVKLPLLEDEYVHRILTEKEMIMKAISELSAILSKTSVLYPKRVLKIIPLPKRCRESFGGWSCFHLKQGSAPSTRTRVNNPWKDIFNMVIMMTYTWEDDDHHYMITCNTSHNIILTIILLGRTFPPVQAWPPQFSWSHSKPIIGCGTESNLIELNQVVCQLPIEQIFLTFS